VEIIKLIYISVRLSSYSNEKGSNLRLVLKLKYLWKGDDITAVMGETTEDQKMKDKIVGVMM